MSLKRKINGVFVDAVNPEIVPGDPGTILTTDENRKPIWTKPTSKFRGAWASAATEIVYDFSDGTIPPEFTFASTVGTPTLVVHTGNGDVTQPPGKSLRIQGFANGTATLSLVIPDTITQLRWKWNSLASSGTNRTMGWNFARNNDADMFVRDQRQGATWYEMSAPVAPGDVAKFKASDAGGWSGTWRLGYIELQKQESPYMLGEHVTHLGKMWRSVVNTNIDVPGETGTWVEAITLPIESGTTAERPAPAVAGAGFQYYDITLGRPIWSNGASWTDAAGVAV